MQNFKLWEMDCWDGFKKVGTKKGKGGKRVNNCDKKKKKMMKYQRVITECLMVVS